MTKWTLEKAQKEFENKGLKLLVSEFKNVDTKMKCLAKCGHEKELSLYNLIQEKGLYCKSCTHTMRGNKRKYSYDFVKREFEKRGCTLLSETYERWDVKLEYKAKCGHKHRITFNKFLSLKQGDYCKVCRFPKGEDHHNYNPQLTNEDRIKNRDIYENEKWRISVYERDNYTCQCCHKNTGGDLNAHHLNGYDKFENERFNVENGITLCVKCHTIFHKTYGYGNNTKEQFVEYMTIPR